MYGHYSYLVFLINCDICFVLCILFWDNLNYTWYIYIYIYTESTEFTYCWISVNSMRLEYVFMIHMRNSFFAKVIVSLKKKQRKIVHVIKYSTFIIFLLDCLNISCITMEILRAIMLLQNKSWKQNTFCSTNII